MISVLAAGLASLGAFFMLVAAIGVVRFRDTFARLHCAGKSATLGIAFMLLAAGLWSQDAGVAIRALVAAVFFLLTGPIGCHAIARAVWRTQPSAPPPTPGKTGARDG